VPAADAVSDAGGAAADTVTATGTATGAAGAAGAATDAGRRRVVSGPSGTLTMMVTDIADSTSFAERLGDRRWIEVLAEHNALVREQVAQHGGTEVKSQGDGFLVVFPSARRAIMAAVDVQRALADFRDDHPDTPIEVRVGLHTGEIVDVDGDVFGQNVVVAVRIADHAEPSEIVVSGLTRDLTVSGGDLSFGPADEVELKGLSEPWRIHRVTWSHAPA
jgi:class 3 adenylate cyclase